MEISSCIQEAAALYTREIDDLDLCTGTNWALVELIRMICSVLQRLLVELPVEEDEKFASSPEYRYTDFGKRLLGHRVARARSAATPTSPH